MYAYGMDLFDAISNKKEITKKLPATALPKVLVILFKYFNIES